MKLFVIGATGRTDARLFKKHSPVWSRGGISAAGCRHVRLATDHAVALNWKSAQFLQLRAKAACYEIFGAASHD